MKPKRQVMDWISCARAERGSSREGLNRGHESRQKEKAKAPDRAMAHRAPAFRRGISSYFDHSC
jgi:hypothetical protein